MGTTLTLVSVDEFYALPETEGEHRELIGGEIVTMGTGKPPHEVVKKNLARILILWLAQNPIAEVFNESMFQVNDSSALIPDLSVLKPNSIDVAAPRITGAPEIAIEVVSSETARRLTQKIDLYLCHGSKSVWVVYPEQRSVWIYAAHRATEFTADQVLEDPALPGFHAPVAAIFEGL